MKYTKKSNGLSLTFTGESHRDVLLYLDHRFDMVEETVEEKLAEAFPGNDKATRISSSADDADKPTIHVRGNTGKKTIKARVNKETGEVRLVTQYEIEAGICAPPDWESTQDVSGLPPKEQALLGLVAGYDAGVEDWYTKKYNVE